MGHYELVMLLHPYKLSVLGDAVSPYLELISKTGNIVALESWGKRSLAYPIKKLLKAEYIFLQFSSCQEGLLELQKSLRYDPLVLRFLLIKLRKNAVYYQTELIEQDLTDKLRQRFNIQGE